MSKNILVAALAAAFSSTTTQNGHQERYSPWPAKFSRNRTKRGYAGSKLVRKATKGTLGLTH